MTKMKIYKSFVQVTNLNPPTQMPMVIPIIMVITEDLKKRGFQKHLFTPG